jgi:predicted ester cyclase
MTVSPRSDPAPDPALGPAETARVALEEVCSGRRPDKLEHIYHEGFADHVNDVTYFGHDGARRSIAGYLALFSDLAFRVDDQVTEGDKVASRWTLTGTHRRRRVELHGVVLSRVRDDQIIEDWAFTDRVELLRQLGAWRSVLLVVNQLWLLLPAFTRSPGGRAARRSAHRC